MRDEPTKNGVDDSPTRGIVPVECRLGNDWERGNFFSPKLAADAAETRSCGFPPPVAMPRFVVVESASSGRLIKEQFGFTISRAGRAPPAICSGASLSTAMGGMYRLK